MVKLKANRFLLITVLALFIMVNNIVTAQDYPSSPINIVVPVQPGGGNDRVARVIASFGQQYLGTTVQVVNMPGGGGATGCQFVADSKPDGYNLLLYVDIAIVAPPIMHDLSYNVNDFQAVANISDVDVGLCVNPKSHWKSLLDVLEYAKVHPGELTYSSAGVGSMQHLALAMLLEQNKVDIKHVPFDGASPALAAVAGGHIDFAIPTLSSIIPAMDAGQVKCITVFGESRRDVLPEVPTALEQGVDYIFTSGRPIVAPKGVPKECIEYLEKRLLKMFKDEEFLNMIIKAGETVENGELIGVRGSVKTDEHLKELHDKLIPILKVF